MWPFILAYTPVGVQRKRGDTLIKDKKPLGRRVNLPVQRLLGTISERFYALDI
jgi:hypothetical protein